MPSDKAKKNIKHVFNHVILGGTFDHFHLGHKKLIDSACLNGRSLTIGLAERNLFKTKLLAEKIEDYKTRKKTVTQYLAEKNCLQKTKFMPIANIYGTTLADKTIDAIVVSRATKKNAQVINQKRKEIGFPELEIIVISDVLAKDNKMITSERIRMGEIDREGSLWEDQMINDKYQNGKKKTILLPEELRSKLREPLGKIIDISQTRLSAKASWSFVISIGDIVSIKLMKSGINPNIKIIDFKTKREPIRDKELLIKNGHKFKVSNPAGEITYESFKTIRKALHDYFSGDKTQTIVVDGEEDLLTLPAILLAPLGSLIFYGQMDKGAIVVLVDEQIKRKIAKILSEFS